MTWLSKLLGLLFIFGVFGFISPTTGLDNPIIVLLLLPYPLLKLYHGYREGYEGN